MRYSVLACDYDGTLVSGERVNTKVLTALHRFKSSGGRLVLLTGRELESLVADFSPIDLFDRVVVENGAVLYIPETKEIRPLAQPPPQVFTDILRSRGVDPLSIGRAIVSTRRPHDAVAAAVIRELGLKLEIVYNKDSVMILPAGTDKSTGLAAVLTEYGRTPAEVVGIGDAENDLKFLSICGFSAAVANAISRVKMEADLILSGPNGSGMVELIDTLLDSES